MYTVVTHASSCIAGLLNYPGAADEEDTEPEQGQPTPRPRQSVAEGMPQSIPEEGSEDPKERRRSMSFSSLRKGFMRRLFPKTLPFPWSSLIHQRLCMAQVLLESETKIISMGCLVVS